MNPHIPDVVIIELHMLTKDLYTRNRVPFVKSF